MSAGPSRTAAPGARATPRRSRRGALSTMVPAISHAMLAGQDAAASVRVAVRSGARPRTVALAAIRWRCRDRTGMSTSRAGQTFRRPWTARSPTPACRARQRVGTRRGAGRNSRRHRTARRGRTARGHRTARRGRIAGCDSGPLRCHPAAPDPRLARSQIRCPGLMQEGGHIPRRGQNSGPGRSPVPGSSRRVSQISHAEIAAPSGRRPRCQRLVRARILPPGPRLACARIPPPGPRLAIGPATVRCLNCPAPIRAACGGRSPRRAAIRPGRGQNSGHDRNRHRLLVPHRNPRRWCSHGPAPGPTSPPSSA